MNLPPNQYFKSDVATTEPPCGGGQVCTPQFLPGKLFSVTQTCRKLTEVEYFSITHGFNLLTVNRAWKKPWFIWRVGAGVVITHPENTIRGKTFDQKGGMADGYYLSGPTAHIALEKRSYLYKGFYASIEGKYTLSWAHIPVANGKADLWNSALHGLFGIGIDF